MARAAANQMVPVLYDEQEVIEIAEQRGKEVAKKLRRKHQVALDELMESIKNQKVQGALGTGGGAIASGLALEGASIAMDMSEPVDTIASGIIGLASIAGSVFIEDSPTLAAGISGFGCASLGRAASGAVRWARR